MTFRVASRTPQAGYALLELSVAVAIASMLAVWGTQALVNRLDDARAQAAAIWLGSVHKAVSAYVRRHGADIQMANTATALAEHGFAEWGSPSLAELVQAGMLSSALPPTVSLIGAARIHVWRHGTCPGENCLVEALVHGERPLKDASRGTVDEAMIAQWLLASQGQGGAVHAGDPARIRGPAFTYNSTLSDGSVLPVGTVGMAVTAEHLATWNFLRVRDARDPDFQGGLSVANDVRSGGHISLSGQLVLGAHARDSEPCVADNAVAHDVYGGLLVCRHNRWRSASRSGGGGYSYNDFHGCKTSDGLTTANPLTDDCSCPWYASPVLIMDTGPRPWPDGRQSAYLCVG